MTSHEDHDKKARRLIGQWYSEQVREGRARYTSDGQHASAAVPDEDMRSREPKGSDPKYWTRKTRFDGDGNPVGLTATGTATRVTRAETKGMMPRGPASDPHQRNGTYEHDEYIAFVRRAMVALQAYSIECHKAVEMEAAGWPPLSIGTDLRITESKARQYIEKGITFISAYRLLYPVRKGEGA